ncbi:hypothetical protein KUCAC02_035516 [Chaenocephalus aceratus]|nr:hypothetical protein KUCAC02_035516 [Chaenocephalus aceratus]
MSHTKVRNPWTRRVLPAPQDSTQRLAVQDEVDPDSLSDASRSDDWPVLDDTKKNQTRMGTLALAGPPTTKSTSFYIGSGGSPGKPDQARCPVKPPPTTVLIRHLSGHEPRRTGVKPNSSAPNLQMQDSVPTRDGGHVLHSPAGELHQRAARRHRSDQEASPHLQPALHQGHGAAEGQHPGLAVLPAGGRGNPDPSGSKFPSSGSARSSKKGGSSTHMDDSLSGESDVDTASTVSQVSSKNAPVRSTSKKRPAPQQRPEGQVQLQPVRPTQGTATLCP